MSEPIPCRAYRLGQILNLSDTELLEQGFTKINNGCLLPTRKGQQLLNEVEPIATKYKDDVIPASVFEGSELNLVEDKDVAF